MTGIRYSLKSLVILTAITGLLLWLIVTVLGTYQYDDAASWLAARGAVVYPAVHYEVAYVIKVRGQTYLDASRVNLDHDCWSQIGKLGELEELMISFDDCSSDECAACIRSNSSSLRSICFEEGEMSLSVASAIEKCKCLRALSFNNVSSVHELESIRPLSTLNTARIKGARGGDEQLAWLESQPSLREVSLSGRFTDSAAAILSQASALKSVDIAHTQITRDGIMQIVRKQRPTRISLPPITLTKADIAELMKSGVEQVDILRATISPSDVSRLVNCETISHIDVSAGDLGQVELPLYRKKAVTIDIYGVSPECRRFASKCLGNCEVRWFRHNGLQFVPPSDQDE